MLNATIPLSEKADAYLNANARFAETVAKTVFLYGIRKK